MRDDTSDTDPLQQALVSFFEKDTYQVNMMRWFIGRFNLTCC